MTPELELIDAAMQATRTDERTADLVGYRLNFYELRAIVEVTMPVIREQLAQRIDALPANRTPTWDGGFESVSLSAVLSIVRGES